MARSSTWKNVERKLAQLLGGERIGVTGRHNMETPDLDIPDLAVEVKHRKSLPALLKKALLQAETAGKAHDKVPIAIFHETGKQYTDSYVVIRMDWFLKFYEKWKANTSHL